MLDVKGVAPQQVTAQLLDMDLNGAIAVGLRVGFPPTIKTTVRFDLNKEPVFPDTGVNNKGFDSADFHTVPPLDKCPFKHKARHPCTTTERTVAWRARL